MIIVILIIIIIHTVWQGLVAGGFVTASCVARAYGFQQGPILLRVKGVGFRV